MEENITISMEEYKNLKYDSLELSYLYKGGVDNWVWYEESLEGMPDKDYFDPTEEY